MLLLKGLSASFRPGNLSLIASFDDASYDYAKFSKYLDLIHLSKELIENAKESGVPLSKLILEISFAVWDTVYDQNDNFEAGDFLRYDEVCDIESHYENIILNRTFYDNRVIIQYSSDDQNGKTHYIRFDSTRTVAQKTRYAIRNNFKGILAHFVDMDDSIGTCATEVDTFDDFKSVDHGNSNNPSGSDKTFPRLTAINDAIILSLHEIEVENRSNGPIANFFRPILSFFF